MRKRRLALFLAAALTFTSVDSVSLIAGAEEVQIIDAGAEDAAALVGVETEPAESGTGEVLPVMDAANGAVPAADAAGEVPEAVPETGAAQDAAGTDAGAAQDAAGTDAEAAQDAAGTDAAGTDAGAVQDAAGTDAGAAQSAADTAVIEVADVSEADAETGAPETDAQLTEGDVLLDELLAGQPAGEDGVFIENIEVEEAEELNTGGLPWEGAQVTELALDEQVTVPAGSTTFWYSFTPGETAEYVFRLPDDITAMVYDSFGNQIMPFNGGNFALELVGEQIYYCSFDRNVGFEDVERVFEVALAKQLAIQSISFPSPKTTFLEGLEMVHFWDEELRIIYTDGTEDETLIRWSDSQGNFFGYNIFDLNGEQAYEGQLTVGKEYIVQITCNNEVVEDAAFNFTVQRPEDAGLPEIKVGLNQVVSGKDSQNIRCYSFTPQQDGYYNFAPVSFGGMYTRNDDGKMESVNYQTDKLTAGKTYYLGLFGSVWIDNEQVYEWEMEVSYLPEIESLTVVSAKDTFIYGLEDVWSCKRDLTFTYTDKSTFQTTTWGGGAADEFGNRIMMQIEGAEGVVYNPKPGAYDVVYSCQGKELCRENITIISIEDAKLSEWNLGTNHVVSSEDYSNPIYYTFTPPKDGLYIFSPLNGCNAWTWSEEQGRTYANINGKLTAGTTYYIGLYGSTFNPEAGEYVYEWDMDISEVPELLDAEIKYVKTKYAHGIDRVYNHYTQLLLKYSNEESQDQVIYGSGGVDSYGNTINCELKNQDDTMVPLNSTVEQGTYFLVFSAQGKELCRQEIQVLPLEEAVEHELIVGTNPIVSGGSDNVVRQLYKFTPAEDGEYRFEQFTRMNVYREYDPAAGYYSYDTYYNHAVLSLKKGETCYLGFFYGMEDEWGDYIYEWDMTISKVSDAEKAVKLELLYDIDEIQAVAGLSNPEDILGNMEGKITYGDGSSEELYLRGCDSVRYYDESGNEADIAAAAPGRYTVKISYRGVELTKPLRIMTVSEALSGTWDMQQPLHIDNTQGIALYKIVTGEQGGRYRLESSVRVDDGGIYTAELADGAVDCLKWLGSYETTAELEAGKEYYLYFTVSSEYRTYTMKAEKTAAEPEIIQMDAFARKSEYLADFDSLKSQDFKTDLKYSDGTTSTVYGEGAVRYDITDEAGEMYDFYEYLPEGTYTVTPNTTSGSAIEVQKNPAKVTAAPLDTASLRRVKTGELVQKNSAGSDYSLYLFVPDKDAQYEYKSEDGMDGYVQAYAYNGMRWMNMPVWEMKAGTEYVLKVQGEMRAFSVQENTSPGENPPETEEQSKGGPLTLGKEESVTYLNPGTWIDYTFTPQESGEYVIRSSERVYMELYVNGEYYDWYNPYGGVSLDLEAGCEYTYSISGDDYGTFDTFTLCLNKVEPKKAVGLEILEDSFELSDGSLNPVDVQIKITYEDGTAQVLPLESKRDDHWNILNWLSRLESKDEQFLTFTVHVRSRVTGDAEYLYAEPVEVKIPALASQSKGELAVGGAVSGAMAGDGSVYYHVKVSESGYYMFNNTTKIAPDSAGGYDGFVIEVTDELRTFYGWGSEEIYLESGEDYYVRIDWYGAWGDIAYQTELQRVKKVTGLEFASLPESLYRRAEIYDEILIRVLYADDTEETVSAADSVLADGSGLDIRYSQINNSKLKVTCRRDGYRVSAYVSLKEPDTAPAMQVNGGTCSITFTDAKYRHLMRVTPEVTGTYGLSSDTQIAGLVWYGGARLLDENMYELGSDLWNGIYLEAGRMYYLITDIRMKDGTAPESINITLSKEGQDVHVCEWTEGMVLKEASCETEGEQEFICSICSAVKNEVIPALGHQYPEEWTKTEPTCTKGGYEERTCARCAQKETQKFVPATGHDFSGEWFTEKKPTETETGTKYLECRNGCGEKQYEVIPATGTQGKVDAVEDLVTGIVPPAEGGLTDEQKTTVAAAVDKLVEIDNEELLALGEAAAFETVTKLEDLAVAANDKISATAAEAASELGVGTPEVDGAALSTAEKLKAFGETLESDETLQAKVDVAASPESYEKLAKKTMAVNITLDIVKVDGQGNTSVVEEDVQPSAPLRVTLDVPQEFVGTVFELYHIAANGTQKIAYTLSADKTKITFATPSLSDFVFAMTDCGADHTWTAEKETVTEPTCTVPGYKAVVCEICGQEQAGTQEIIGALPHQYTVEVSSTSADCATGKPGTRKLKCETCDATVTETIQPVHTWNNKTTEPTCGTEGYTIRTCEVCRTQEKINIIPATDNHVYELVVVKQPTCGEAGEQYDRCTVCGDEGPKVYPPATGAHTFKVVTDLEATCGAAGSQHKECAVCGLKGAAEAVPATGAHTFKVVTDLAATCGAAGSQHRECTVCGYKEAATPVPAAGAHQFGDYAVTKEATVLAEGTKTRTCKVCGTAETASVAKLQAVMELNAKKLTLKTGQTTKVFKVTEMAAGDSVLSITSSNKKIVKVSAVKANGTCTLKGVKKGSAKLTITLASGLKKTVKVKVQTGAVKTTSIKGVEKKLTLKMKQKVKLTPSLEPITSVDKITYTSSNKKVVTVTSKGQLKAVKPGKANITIKAGKKKFVCKVTVKK